MVDKPIDVLFTELHQQGIMLWIEGEKLRSRAPKGVVTDEMREEIKERKRELIQFLSQASHAHTSIPIAPPSARLQLSFAEERLWFIHQLEPTLPIYTIPLAYRLQGDLDVSALQQSIAALVDRHESLRTTFETHNGQPIRVVADKQPIALPVIAVDGESSVEQWIVEEQSAVFDLEKGPLFRVKLLQTAPDVHVFLMSMHHIISDEWSADILWRELQQLYDGFRQSPSEFIPASVLPPLSIQYADFAHWQRTRKEEILKRQLPYWQKQLQDVPPLIALPTDHVRPQEASYRGGSVECIIAPDIHERLVSLSQQMDTTLFMTLLTAFNVLLFRYAGQTQIVVGTPMTNRMTSQTEDVIGFFLNTLVLCNDLVGDLTFAELLQRVRTKTLDAFEHQELPFERLVEELQLARSFGYNPLFQVMFVLQSDKEQTFHMSDIRVTRILYPQQTAKFDLTLSIQERDGQLRAHFNYSRDLFEEETIKRMAAHFQMLLASVTAKTPVGIQQPISQIAMMTDEERRQLESWNETQVAYDSDICLHQLFEAQAERTPDAMALFFDGQQLTYAELNSYANKLAHYLHARGIDSNMTVGICVERSLKMVISVLAVLKAGCIYVPLDPSYPQERLSFMLYDADIELVLTQVDLHDHLNLVLSNSKITYIDLDSIWNKVAAQPSDSSTIITQPHDSAYLLYTSGSTGSPKGVMTKHKAIANRIIGMQQQFPLQRQERTLQKTPLSFDVSVWEIFWPLSSGATLVIAHPDGHKDPNYLVKTIQQLDVTTVYFNCSMLNRWMEAKDVTKCTSLKRIFCGGEALSIDLMQRVFARLDVKLHNLYGPTEAAIYVSHWQCIPTYTRPTIPIGHPVSNVQLYIVDEAMHPVPIGVVGELLIGGIQVAEGYYKRPELTSEKFIPDHLSTNGEGGLLYRTGDLA
ncbi:MAG: amino acid adenylation domain-containing protein, partial [Chloroflexota bacterium]